MTKYVITNPVNPELDINSQEDAQCAELNR
jgi:hypothetical protein